MAIDKTAFLNMDLQKLGDNVNTWGTVEAANFNKVDDAVVLLDDALVTTPGSDQWANLKGTKDSLEQRLDVGVNDDGTLDGDAIDNSAKSHIEGTSSFAERLLVGERIQFLAALTSTYTKRRLFNYTRSSRASAMSKSSTSLHSSWYPGSGSGVTSPVHAAGQLQIDSDFNDVSIVIGGDNYIYTRGSWSTGIMTASVGKSMIGYTPLTLSEITGTMTAPDFFMDSQLTCDSSTSGNTTGSVLAAGNSRFASTGIGVSGSAVNDWLPVSGDILKMSTGETYVIENVSNDYVDIYGEFEKVYSSAVWEILDIRQANIALWLTSSLAMASEISVFKNIFCHIGAVQYQVSSGATADIYLNLAKLVQIGGLSSTHVETSFSADKYFTDNSDLSKTISTALGAYPNIIGLHVGVVPVASIISAAVPNSYSWDCYVDVEVGDKLNTGTTTLGLPAFTASYDRDTGNLLIYRQNVDDDALVLCRVADSTGTAVINYTDRYYFVVAVVLSS